MRRIPILPLLVFSGLTLAGCASAPSEEPSPPPPDEPVAEGTCTAWTLDITNHTGLELHVYEYRGEKLVDPGSLMSPAALKGHLVQVVPRRRMGSSLLFGARPEPLRNIAVRARQAFRIHL
jgi:hypothetical protein